jgi:hypothetical protein
LIWLVLVKIPIRIFTFTLVLIAACVVLSIIRIYLADDHGAASMGAEMGFGVNSAGIM